MLEVLLLNPKDRFYQRQLSVRLGLPIMAIQRELRNLSEMGLLEVRTEGNRVYYSVHPRFPILPELTGIFLKAAGVGDVLGDVLRRHKGKIMVALIYGSYARGRPESWSDIDLMLIGTVSDLAISQALDKAEQRVGREVNHVRYTPENFRKKVGARDPFLLTVLREPKVFVMGDLGELERLAGR